MRKRLVAAALALVSVPAARALILVGATVPALTSQRMKPTEPGTPGDPRWQGQVRLKDGRTFVTDGGLAIDAALARPDPLPARVLAAKVLEDYLAAKPKDEFSVNDLKKAANGRNLHRANRRRPERNLYRLSAPYPAGGIAAHPGGRGSQTRGGRLERGCRRRADAGGALAGSLGPNPAFVDLLQP